MTMLHGSFQAMAQKAVGCIASARRRCEKQNCRCCVGTRGTWQVVETEGVWAVLCHTSLHRPQPLRWLVPAPAMAKLHLMTQYFPSDVSHRIYFGPDPSMREGSSGPACSESFHSSCPGGCRWGHIHVAAVPSDCGLCSR